MSRIKDLYWEDNFKVQLFINENTGCSKIIQYQNDYTKNYTITIEFQKDLEILKECEE